MDSAFGATNRLPVVPSDDRHGLRGHLTGTFFLEADTTGGGESGGGVSLELQRAWAGDQYQQTKRGTSKNFTSTEGGADRICLSKTSTFLPICTTGWSGPLKMRQLVKMRRASATNSWTLYRGFWGSGLGFAGFDELILRPMVEKSMERRTICR